MAWQRGRAYSQDLRDRVLAAENEPIRAIAERLDVSPSYVSKVRSKRRDDGITEPGRQGNHVRPRLEPHYAALRARVAEAADATITELRAWAAQALGVSVSHPVMWKTLDRLGLTLKKSASARPSRTAPPSRRRAPSGPNDSRSSTRGG